MLTKAEIARLESLRYVKIPTFRPPDDTVSALIHRGLVADVGAKGSFAILAITESGAALLTELGRAFVS